ncbi:MAG: amidohydrolase family protein, partial [Planctomycetes bacterium]|nr:amidohydrolase family protein [Planctomycetota bacterium]
KENRRRGNARLMDQIRGHDRLLPCWVVAPPSAGEPDPDRTVSAMKNAGVVAARLCPKSQYHQFNPLICGPILEKLAAARIPVIVDFQIIGWGETHDWAGLSAVAGAFPDLPFIVPGCVLKASGNVHPCFHRHSNLYLDIGAYQEPEALADFVGTFGSHRALFGTYYPARGVEIALGLLHGRQLCPGARKAIAGANLSAILKGKTPEPVAPGEPAPMAKLPLAAIDVHVHIDFDDGEGTEYGPRQAVEAFDAWGVQCGIASHWAGLSGYVREGNEDMLNACRKFPGRLYAWAVFDASQPDISADSARKMLREDCFVGFKVHTCIDERTLADDGYDKMFEIANELEVPVLNHGNNDEEFAKALEKIAKKYPRVNILHAHHGGTSSPDYAKKLSELLERFPNLYHESCASFAPPDAIANLVRASGGKRLCYGTDLGFMDNDGQTGKVLFADITESQRADVLRNNALRLIRRLPR